MTVPANQDGTVEHIPGNNVLAKPNNGLHTMLAGASITRKRIDVAEIQIIANTGNATSIPNLECYKKKSSSKTRKYRRESRR